MTSTSTEPYYADDLVTLYLGDCLEVDAWLDADYLLTDPPYGRSWRQGGNLTNIARQGVGGNRHAGIAGDTDTLSRDAVLARWSQSRPAAVFGDLCLPPPENTRQVLIYRKPADAGVRGATAGHRRDAEAIYLVGQWPSQIGGCSSVLSTNANTLAGPRGFTTRSGHPHCKPLDLMEYLAGLTAGVIADPFAGSGSTLLAARNCGRRAIGVEIDERYAELAARRLNQQVLSFG